MASTSEMPSADVNVAAPVEPAPIHATLVDPAPDPAPMPAAPTPSATQQALQQSFSLSNLETEVDQVKATFTSWWGGVKKQAS